MIDVIHYQNEAVEKTFEAVITKSYDEVRRLLPGLPEIMKIYFSNEGIMETGVGAHAHDKDIITLSLDPDFENKETQRADIRPTVFHESFHVYQGFTYEGTAYDPIEVAIYEGIATIFEREYAQTIQPFGIWNKVPIQTLNEWVGILRTMPLDEYEANWEKWKFYHPELKERWIMYKTGAYVVDTVLTKHHLDILDLRDKTAQEVLDLF